MRLACPKTGYSRREIRKITQEIRDTLGFGNGYLPIVFFLESLDAAGAVNFEVVPPKELDKDLGRYVPFENKILIREDVYIKASERDGSARFTIAHEIGHSVLHWNRAFSRGPKPKGNYECPEWQAECFAGELLVDVRGINNLSTVFGIARKFYVTPKAANTQVKAFLGQGLLEGPIFDLYGEEVSPRY